MSTEAALEIAVARIKEGLSSDRVIAELVEMGTSDEAARQIVAHARAMQREHVLSLFKQGKSAAEVWTALVSGGVERAAAEALVKEVIELRREAEIERQHLDSGFCKNCLDDSLDISPGDIAITYVGVGKTFYGNAEACLTCGSVVRILWHVFFFFPVIPQGTYRYLNSGAPQNTGTQIFARRRELTRFVARRTQTRTVMVLRHWGVALALFAVLALFFIGPALAGRGHR